MDTRERILDRINTVKASLAEARNPTWQSVDSYPVVDIPPRIFFVNLLINEVEVCDCFIHPVTGLWMQYNNEALINQELITKWRPKPMVLNDG